MVVSQVTRIFLLALLASAMGHADLRARKRSARSPLTSYEAPIYGLPTLSHPQLSGRLTRTLTTPYFSLPAAYGVPASTYGTPSSFFPTNKPPRPPPPPPPPPPRPFPSFTSVTNPSPLPLPPPPTPLNRALSLPTSSTGNLFRDVSAFPRGYTPPSSKADRVVLTL